jgi:lysozyme family protein
MKPFMKKVMQWEGGFSDHSADRGGKTLYGVRLDLYLDWFPSHTEHDFMRMTKEEAADLLYKKYSVDFLSRFPEFEGVFVDASINTGKRTAVSALQHTLNFLNFDDPKAILETDGIFGSHTQAVFESYWDKDKDKLLHAFIDQRIRFYVNLVVRRPKQLVFLRGWISRALSWRP